MKLRRFLLPIIVFELTSISCLLRSQTMAGQEPAAEHILVVGDQDSRNIAVIEASTATRLVFDLIEEIPMQVLTSPNGRWAAIVARSEESTKEEHSAVYLFEPGERWVIKRVEFDGSARVAATDREGTQIVVLSRQDARTVTKHADSGMKLDIIDTAVSQVVATLERVARPLNLAISSSGRYAYVLSAPGGSSSDRREDLLEVFAVSLANHEEVRTFAIPRVGRETPSFVPIDGGDAIWLFVPGEFRKQIYEYPIKGGALRRRVRKAGPASVWKLTPTAGMGPVEIELPRLPMPPVLTRNGSCLYTAGFNAEGTHALVARVCRGDTGKIVPLDTYPFAIHLSRENDRLFLATMRGIISLDATSMNILEQPQLEGQKEKVAPPQADLGHLQLTKDGQYAVALRPHRTGQLVGAHLLISSLGIGGDTVEIPLGGKGRMFSQGMVTGLLSGIAQLAAFPSADYLYIPILYYRSEIGARPLAFDASGKVVFALNRFSQQIVSVDLESGKIIKKIKTKEPCFGILSRPSNRAGLMACANGLWRLNLVTGQLESTQLTKRETGKMSDGALLAKEDGQPIVLRAEKGIWLVSAEEDDKPVRLSEKGLVLLDIMKVSQSQ